jgi:hypothetical protein
MASGQTNKGTQKERNGERALAAEIVAAPTRRSILAWKKADITQCEHGGAIAVTRYGRSCPQLDGRASTKGRGSKSSS